ncbi:hypothetical protein FHETE_6032 [Fusarium heterosporum]|uniref:MACPF-like domain-containing protein n=1 Tax=Fusarium heterosporum TaxID=42747 RepID=A0A8H5T7Y8_FUSHE|nr:hypothetical protein FHETE_6032 [Fusarium heterosporum]
MAEAKKKTSHDGSTILRVFTYEPGTKVCKQKRTLEFLETKKPEELKLEVIRSLLVQHKVLGSLDARNPFCDSYGAEMADSMNFNVYLRQLGEAGKGKGDTGDANEDKKPAGASEDNNDDNTANGDESKKERPLSKTKSELIQQTLKVYYKKRKVQTKTDNATQEFLKKKLDLKLQLKKRFFDSYEIAAPEANGKGASTAEGLGTLPAHIPRFRVDDSSYVSVVETQNSLQSSMAKSSFSQSSIEASAGGGVWGISAAAKGGFSLQEGGKDVTAQDEKHQKIHVVYNFPRVTLFMDAGSLELTDEVMSDIAVVKTKEDVISFGDKYGLFIIMSVKNGFQPANKGISVAGHVFSRRVKIGGRLMSSHQIDSDSDEKQEERENSLKASAAVSFSGFGVSASAEASHSSGSKSGSDTKKQNFASNMAWEATGGNTTLCNDPPQWCSTVGNFRNWRIVEQGDIIPLTQLISTFKGFEGTEAQFRRAANIPGGGIPSGRRVRTRIQLVDTATNKFLVALQSPNHFKEALEWIAIGRSSPSVGTSKNEIIDQVSAGCITYAADQKKYSNWVLERWVETGRSPKHLYGAKTFIFNEAMPEQARFLGLTDPIVDTDGSGFLYPASNADKAWFTLESPPGMQSKSGPLDTGDIVELRVRDSGDSADLGVLMRAEYHGNSSEIQRSIEQVPAFTPRKRDGTDIGQTMDRALDSNSGRFLQFRIVVNGMSEI